MTAPVVDNDSVEILPGKYYTLHQFETITGIGPGGRRTAEEEGLKVATIGRNRFILGDAWFEYLALKSAQSNDWCKAATALLHTISYLGEVRRDTAEASFTETSKEIDRAMIKADAGIRKMVAALLQPVSHVDLPDVVTKACKAAGIF